MADSPLESRFLEPDGWRWDYFTNAQGARIHFGAIDPPGAPRAVAVMLPGLSEFGEKYFETARDMLARGLAFRVIDWRGQGKSDRYLSNPHKRHTAGFAADVADLHQMVEQHIIPASGGAKLVMLAHSMGGNIGLRYLSGRPGTFAAAAFSAPMLGIHAFAGPQRIVMRPLVALLARTAGTHYIFGGGDWQPGFRDRQAKDVLTSDPVRSRIHNAWCLRDPALQVGNVTFGWLDAALDSCERLARPGAAEGIDIPCLFAVAGREKLVDNAALRAFAGRVKGAKMLELGQSCHEILMERDEFRVSFLRAFDALL